MSVYNQSIYRYFKYSSNNKAFCVKSQVLSTITVVPVKEVVSSPKEFLLKQHESVRKVLNILVLCSNRYSITYPTHQKIALWAGVSIATCKRALDILREYGVIGSAYRHMKSCLYKMASLLGDTYIRSQLVSVCWAFKYMPLLLLTLDTVSNPMSYDINIREYFYKYPSVLESQLRGSVRKLRGKKRGEFVVKQQMSPVSEAIRGNVTKLLNLTRAGQLRLSAFPDEAINHAYNLAKHFKNPRDPYAFFVAKCGDYCEQRNLEPDWEYAKTLEAHYKIAPGAPLVMEKKIDVKDKPCFKVVKKEEDNRTYEQKVATAKKGAACICLPVSARQELHEKKLQGMINETDPVYWYLEFAPSQPLMTSGHIAIRHP